jgi:hypothetical protein
MKNFVIILFPILSLTVHAQVSVGNSPRLSKDSTTKGYVAISKKAGSGFVQNTMRLDSLLMLAKDSIVFSANDFTGAGTTASPVTSKKVDTVYVNGSADSLVYLISGRRHAVAFPVAGGGSGTLYGTTGSHTDGGMTQDATTKALGAKLDTSASTYFNQSHFYGSGDTSANPLSIKGKDSIKVNGGSYAPLLFNPSDTSISIAYSGNTFKWKINGTGTSQSGTTLSAPSLSATAISSSQINVTVGSVANSSSYNLDWSANGSTGWTSLTTTSGTYNHTGLTASTPYYYRARSVGNGTTYLTSTYATANTTTSSSAGGSSINLVSNSEDLSSSIYSLTNATVSTNSAIAPDGTTTADKLIDNSTNGRHEISFSIAKAASAKTYTLSFYVKGAEYGAVRLIGGYEAAGGFYSIWTGTTLTNSGADGPYSYIGSGSSAVANGYNRLYITFTTDNLSTLPIYIQLENGSSSNGVFTGTGSSGVYIWGMQLEEGTTMTTYVKTP